MSEGSSNRSRPLKIDSRIPSARLNTLCFDRVDYLGRVSESPNRQSRTLPGWADAAVCCPSAARRGLLAAAQLNRQSTSRRCFVFATIVSLRRATLQHGTLKDH